MFVVIIFCIAIGNDFIFGSGSTTHWKSATDDMVVTQRYFYPAVYDHRAEYRGDTMLRSTTQWHVLAGLLLFLGTAAVSLGLAKCAAWLRPRARIGLSLAIILGSLWLLSFGLSVWFSISYWGYWPRPPRLDERVTTARRVTGIGGFTSGTRDDPSTTRWSRLPEARRGTATGYPLEYTMNEWKQAGLPTRTRGNPPLTLAELKQLPLDSRIQIKNEAGYNSQSGFLGFWAELEARDGRDLLYVVGNGAERSNDHQPHYRLLYERNGAKLDLIGHQLFYFDVAGIEWMTWASAFCLLAVLASWCAVGLTFIFLGAAHLRQRRIGCAHSSS